MFKRILRLSIKGIAVMAILFAYQNCGKLQTNSGIYGSECEKYSMVDCGYIGPFDCAITQLNKSSAYFTFNPKLPDISIKLTLKKYVPREGVSILESKTTNMEEWIFDTPLERSTTPVEYTVDGVVMLDNQESATCTKTFGPNDINWEE